MGKSIRNLSTVTRVGLDLAKRVFQVHAVEAKGEIVVARKLTRFTAKSFVVGVPAGSRSTRRPSRVASLTNRIFVVSMILRGRSRLSWSS
jgi:hypothetical protein